MKLAVIFPGIGYHSDKPLLYHSKKIAKEAGYDIFEVKYSHFPSNVKGNVELMNQCVSIALDQAKDLLQEIDFSKYSNVLFISKSIGTAVAAACSNEFALSTRNVYYTPIEQTFIHMKQSGIVFHGNADDWVDSKLVVEECKRLGYPLYVTEGGNHSLEVGDTILDLDILRDVMVKTKDYILS